MGSFSYKSSGVTQQTAPANQLAVTPLPIGILTPLRLGTTDLLATSTSLAMQMGDNLRNLISTNWGERLGLYNYGANLRPLMADLVSQDDFDSQAITRIRAAVKQWMPYIVLQDFTSNVDTAGKLTSGLAQITLTISYNVPSLGVTNKALVVTLYAM